MHTHEHHHHKHHTSHRVLGWAILLTLGFALVEALGGYFAHSLALLGDAGHMASDAVALGIAAFASWIALRPPSHKHSYGFGRAEVIAAWASSLLMVIIALAVIVEAIKRIQQPSSVHSVPVMLIAVFGILLNVLLAGLISRSEKTLNIRAVLLHVVSDIVGTCAVLLSGIVIFFSHWALIDPLLSVLIGILIIISSVRLWRESMTVLMEGVPAHLNIKQVSQTMVRFEGVKAVHDVHIWTLSSGVTALSAHVNIKNITSWDDVLLGLKSTLKQQYDIDHITLQPEADIEECTPCYKL
ncbi:cation transporter [Coxiella burnetii]|uniref:Cobalt-zinc-cadmium resistance protein n=1 Tax=Coxiella burnetii (strain Dugway 5J108-111) TaxID=434922 RepID=A9KGL5_COXBN|nr:cation diffusion facilitator family transporter [Coxiella burnetii]ABS77684.1 cobalt-zinc-cadmium resistance protein [Coxiella burnetii Dugway 5J108-111]OYK79602.1 cation transporter [Coxiella burnetii]OYK81684.1 cation transporter [Coxiella burnetii]